MPTFIDESGDTGCMPSSSPHFLLCAVTVPTEVTAESIRASIKQVRLDLRLKANFEFKFSWTSRLANYRRAILDAALGHDFQFTIASIDKSILPQQLRKPRELQRVTATALAESLGPILLARWSDNPSRFRRETVTVDDNDDRDFLQTLKRVFRTVGRQGEGRLSLVDEVRFRKSHSDEMLQLADMIGGAFAAQRDGDDLWYRTVASRSLRSWQYSPPGAV